MARRTAASHSEWRTPGPAQAVTRRFVVERVTRIELALSAWEADVLPLNYTRMRRSVRTTLYPMTSHEGGLERGHSGLSPVGGRT
jgi:hypothetical protein